MIFRLDDLRLRKAESKDIEALYYQKNDPEVANLLGGFGNGYSRQDIADWIDSHRQYDDEVLWIIADWETDGCLGHVGLYKIDHRIRSAEYAILLGCKERWGTGIGRRVSRFVLDYAFKMLNLNRVALNVFEHHHRARRLYRSLGFQEEGVLRQAQYKQGLFLNVLVMGILRDEYAWEEP